MASSKKLAQTYQQKTDIEHILDAPDTYIGSVESDEIINWILDKNDNFIYNKYQFLTNLCQCN